MSVDIIRTALDGVQRELGCEFTDWEGWYWPNDFGDPRGTPRQTLDVASVQRLVGGPHPIDAFARDRTTSIAAWRLCRAKLDADAKSQQPPPRQLRASRYAKCATQAAATGQRARGGRARSLRSQRVRCP
jgi:hypothetical protein